MDWLQYSDVDFVEMWDDGFSQAAEAIQRLKRKEKEQMVDEILKELYGLLKDGESLRISRIKGNIGAVGVISVVDAETGIFVEGGTVPTRLLASRI